MNSSLQMEIRITEMLMLNEIRSEIEGIGYDDLLYDKVQAN